MMENMGKKIIVCVIVLVFLGLAMSPMIDAQITENDFNGTKNMVEEFSGKTVNCGDNSIYDLLILTPKKFTRNLQSLVDHKERVDIKTRMVTLDEVYETMFWHGRDNPEKIKYFIKTARDEWGIKYVLLVGNFRQFPIRYVYNEHLLAGYPEPRFISDLYYADIYDESGENFSSWDTNNNGIYGEWKGGEAQDENIDLRPDVYVGRLACKNNVEVRIMVEKIITYEMQTYDKDWFKRMVVVAGDTYATNESRPAYEGEENTQRALDYMQGFTPVKLWTSTGTLTGPKDIIRTINGGCGFVFFDGHATPTQWFTYLPKGDDIRPFKVQHMSLLSNKNMLPICVAPSCHNCQFDVNLGNIVKGVMEDGIHYFGGKGNFRMGEWIPECWGWRLTRTVGGGAIATIGNTGIGYTKEDKGSMDGAGDYLDPQFFWEYGVNGTDILGDVWGKTITDYLKNYPIDWETPAGGDFAIDVRVVQMWVLFGDPSLKIGGYPCT